MKKVFILSLMLSYSFADTYIYNYRPTYQVNYVNINNIVQQNNINIGNININSRDGGKLHILHRDYRTYHLGDENFRSRKWARLHGQCYFIKFYDDGYRGDYYISLKRFGTESAAVFMNSKALGYLPDQSKGYRKRPNYWSKQEWISIPDKYIRRGRNTLAICSSPVPNPEFRGDVDDFQIKNILLVKIDN